MASTTVRPRKVVGSSTELSASSRRNTPTSARSHSSTISASTISKSSHNAPLKAKVDLSGLNGVAGPSTPTSFSNFKPQSRGATPEGARTIRARTTPGSSTVGTSRPNLSAPIGVAGPVPTANVRPGSGFKSAAPPGSAPPSAPFSSGHSRPTSAASRSARSPSRSAVNAPSNVTTRNRSPKRATRLLDDLPASVYARLAPSSGVGLPFTIGSASGVSLLSGGVQDNPVHVRARKTSGTGSALSAAVAPTSRARINSLLLPSPSIGPTKPPSGISLAKSGVAKWSQPGSPLTSPNPLNPSSGFGTNGHVSDGGPSRLSRSPPERSSGSSTLSHTSASASSTLNWPHRRSVSAESSRSSNMDDDGDGMMGIEGRLGKAQGQWLESEAERLERIEREEGERELREREGEARVNRQILDLEISNASLLAINAGLERAKVKQTAEIRDLRRKMRDKSFAPLGATSFSPLLSPTPTSETFPSSATALDDSDTEPEVDFETLLREDPKFHEVTSMMEALLRSGQEAMEWQPKQADLGMGGKVLNRMEVEEREMEEEERGLGLEMEGTLFPPHRQQSGISDAGSSRPPSPAPLRLRNEAKETRECSTQTDPRETLATSPRFQLSPVPSPTTPAMAHTSSASSAASSILSATSDLQHRFPSRGVAAGVPNVSIKEIQSQVKGKEKDDTAARPGSRGSSPSVKVLAGMFVRGDAATA